MLFIFPNCRMMIKVENNPWSVQKWEEFLYFCCPECDEKSQSKDHFITHALSIHPMAKICLETIESEIDLKENKKDNFQNSSEKLDVKSEYQSAGPLLVVKIRLARQE